VNLEQIEREKYARIWSHKEYSDNSPGERLVPYFLKHVPFTPGDDLIDLGCGTGRAGAALGREGLQVYLFDHVNAVEFGIHLPFIEGNLWEPFDLFGFDWFYCCDVMEHIPPEKVDRVLDNIAALATKGGFFQIALFPDEWFGEVLHLTVESSDWWTKKLQARWPKVTIDTPEKRRIAAIVGY
jgi:SAM-dependent methyltransferase